MNRAQLRKRVQSRLRIPPAGDPLLDEPTLNDKITEALNDVSSISDWPWLLTTSALTFTAGIAPMPANMVKVRDVYINGFRARGVELGEFLDEVGLAYNNVWTIIGTNIQLTPVPSVVPTATLYYIQQEPALTLDTASPLIPEAHQGAVVARASYHAEIHRAKADAAQFHNGEYQECMKRMMDATKRVNKPRQVRLASVQRWATW